MPDRTKAVTCVDTARLGSVRDHRLAAGDCPNAKGEWFIAGAELKGLGVAR
jgi:hypothetical protein